MKPSPLKPMALRLFIVCLLVNTQAIATYSVTKHTIINGGGLSTGDNYQVVGSLGQKEAVHAGSGNDYQLAPGFWAANNNDDLIFRNGFE